jgi:hypothetical protein
MGYRPVDICMVTEYNTTGEFDEYSQQEVILFDEFDSQLSLTKMNAHLHGEPHYLHGRNFNRIACYTKAFLTSNYPLEHQYTKERE